MKTSIFLLFAFGFSTFSGIAQTQNHSIDYVAKTTATPSACIEVPSEFAKENLFNQSVLRVLKNKEVVKVELWYTRFKENPAFDQVKLNNQRVKRLQSAFPELKNKNIEWVWKEQTDANTKEEAKTCFHGFRIFTKEETPLWTNEYRIQDPSNTVETISVDAVKGKTFTSKSGSIIHIPPMAVADRNGIPVTGNFDVQYSEFRNAAEIAYSGLPMNFSENGEDFAFNSAGMYEIRGYQNNQPLQLVQPITVDFNCTDQIKDLNFYALDQQTGTWLKRQQLNFTQEKVAAKPVAGIAAKGIAVSEIVLFPNNLTMKYTTDEKKVCTSNLDKENWRLYEQLKKREPDYVQKVVFNEIASKQQIQFNEKDAEELTGKLFGDAWQVNTDFGSLEPIKDVQPNATLLGAGVGDPGHTYPNMVKGLNSPKFGVYNCDQQYRMGPTVTLKPTYIDKQTGAIIQSAHVMCVIDRNINGSFSFNPAMITMSKDQLTDLVLFTKENKVYYVSSKDLALQQTDGVMKFEMTDITKKVKSSADLQAFLKL